MYVVDQIGDAGRSMHDGRPLRRAADLTEWLETVLDGLGLAAAAVVGHSYGAWLALRLAVQAPRRVSRLVLLDPTGCVGGMRLPYRLHAVPLFARPSAAAMRRFVNWETGGAPLDPTWLHLASLAGGEVRGSPMHYPGSRRARSCAPVPCRPRSSSPSAAGSLMSTGRRRSRARPARRHPDGPAAGDAPHVADAGRGPAGRRDARLPSPIGADPDLRL